MVNPAVRIFCDVNQTIGYGHLRRSLSLKESLCALNISVSISHIDPLSSTYIPTQPQVTEDQPSVVVFDTPYDISQAIISFRERGVKTVALDWFGSVAPDYAIVVYPHRKPKARIDTFVGLQYFLIRQEFLALNKRIPESFIPITLGGKDIFGNGPLIANQLLDIGLKPILINGPLSDKRKYTSFKSLDTPIDYPQIIHNSEWVITNGGGCMLESLFLGKGIVSIPQSSQENALASYLISKNAILGIGRQAIRNFSKSEIDSISNRAKELLDGQGLQRVTSIIASLV